MTHSTVLDFCTSALHRAQFPCRNVSDAAPAGPASRLCSGAMRFLFFSLGCQPQPSLVQWRGTCRSAHFLLRLVSQRRHCVPQHAFPLAVTPRALVLARPPSISPPFASSVFVDASPVCIRWLPRSPWATNSAKPPRIFVTSPFLHHVSQSCGAGVGHNHRSSPKPFLNNNLTFCFRQFALCSGQSRFTRLLCCCPGSRASRVFILRELTTARRRSPSARWPSDDRPPPVVPILFQGVVGFLNRPLSCHC